MFTSIMAGIGIYAVGAVTVNRLIHEADEGRLTKTGLLVAGLVIGGYAIRFGYAVTKEAAKLTYTVGKMTVKLTYAVGKMIVKLVSKPFRKTATA